MIVVADAQGARAVQPLSEEKPRATLTVSRATVGPEAQPREIDLSVLIPAFNAEMHLQRTVEEVARFLVSLQLTFEIVVTDDGSTDRTPNILAELAQRFPELHRISLPRNQGKGAAVHAAFRASRGAAVIFMDVDGATDLEVLPAFLATLRTNDIAIASRHHAASRVPTLQPAHRRLMGLVMRKLVQRVTGVSLADTQCGFKMFTRSAAEQLFAHQLIHRFAFDVELCYLAQLYGLRLVELPVTWRDQRGSSVRLLRDPLNMILDVFRIRLNDLRGRYA